MKILSEQEIWASFGSFWELFNRIKRGRIEGLVGLACSETGFSLDQQLGSGLPKAIVQNPGGCCGGSWRQSVSEALRSSGGGTPTTDIVLLTHHGCNFLESSSAEEHCLLQLRRLLTLDELSELKSRRRPRLHAWMIGARGEFLVLKPQFQRFVSPLTME
jgi:hypothetical protein